MDGREPIRSDELDQTIASAYRIRRPADLGDVMVERTAGDLALWLVSIVGQTGWVPRSLTRRHGHRQRRCNCAMPDRR